MPVALEGAADVVLIAGLFLLIGLIYALRFTLVTGFRQLDVTILGARPFHGIAARMEAAVLSATDDAIKASQAAIAGLWHATVWSFKQMVDATKDLARDTEAALRLLRHVTVPALLSVASATLLGLVGPLPRAYASVSEWLHAEVARLEGVIDRKVAAGVAAAERVAAGLAKGIEADVLHELSRTRAELERGIEAGVRTAEREATRGIDALRDAEHAALEGVRSAEGATAAELRHLLGELDLTNLRGLLAAFPILAAAVAVLEAESGLDKRECREKVRQVCTTDPARWAHLLEGLVAVGLAFDLEALAAIARPIVHAAEPLIREAA